MDDQKREITEAVATRIKYFRKLKDMSQEDLALRANINPAYFGQVERGLKCPTIDTLYKIAKALEISPSELLRSDAFVEYTDDDSRRIKDILSRVPAAKRSQLLRVIESMAELF